MALARTAPSPRRAATTRARQLEVVGREERVRSVGTMGTIFVLFVFATLFALAALHAVLVQTQSRIDAINADNQVLQEELDTLVALEAWLDSPAGLREAAAVEGLVEATDVVTLVPVPDGELAPPAGDDPFGPGGPG